MDELVLIYQRIYGHMRKSIIIIVMNVRMNKWIFDGMNIGINEKMNDGIYRCKTEWRMEYMNKYWEYMNTYIRKVWVY